jgi:hypothetical protein
MFQPTTTDSQPAFHDEAEPNKQTKPNRFSFWVTTLTFFMAFSIIVITPLLAIQWSRVPFPGFVIEQSGVVANIGSQGWSGREAGIDHPQRVTAFDDKPVTQPEALESILLSLESGQEATAQTVEPSGLTRSYTSIEIMSYPFRDLMKFFWLPYFIGFVYLLIGGVIYILRCHTRAGLSFAFFCAWTSIVCALSFDLSTTHQGTALWTLAISMLGGAISGLAFLFPNEIEPLHQRSWLRIFTYVISAGLTIWGW